MRRTIKTILATLLTGGIVAFVICVVPPFEEIRGYDRYATNLRRDLGFDHGSPFVLLGTERKEVFTLHPTTPASLLARAGVSSGDIVVDDFGHSIPRFYSELENARGRVYRFRVATGGDGPPLRERLHKIIEVRVPNYAE